MNPFLTTDGYKLGHIKQYPKNTTLVYSNFTPRHGKHTNVKGGKGVISFGQQMVMRQIKEMFDEHFFQSAFVRGIKNVGHSDEDLDKYLGQIRDQVCQEIKREYSMYLGEDFDVSHIESLWNLGYLPIKVKALPEGTFVPYGVPVLTIVNTKPEFFWLTNFLETLISNMLWMPMTSATTAKHYKDIMVAACQKTDENSREFVEFQGHNFGMRGMGGLDATVYAGMGHATSFMGDDSLPTIMAARKYYDEEGFVVGSVNATEHSVMCAGGNEDELGTFRYLMSQFPTGILSIVSDTWDLWRVIMEFLPILKEEILARDGKIVIRPDSGDPVDIICGNKVIKDFTDKCPDLEYCGKYSEDGLRDKIISETEHGECGDDEISETFKFQGKYYKCTAYPEWNRYDKQYYYVDGMSHKVEEVTLSHENKGVIELLWDLFGGTINSQGYKVLDPHIGAIYGDSITPARCTQICERLEAKGFASTNIVFGIGSYTYQMVTRDTHGFAMKATYVEIATSLDKFEMQDFPQHVIDAGHVIQGREIFKDPITGDGSKKSAKGLLSVLGTDNLYLLDQVTWEGESEGELQLIFEDGVFHNVTTLTEIRKRLNEGRIN